MITIRAAQDMSQAGPLLSKALAYDVGSAAGQLDDMTRNCVVFEMLDGARVVGAFSAVVEAFSSGRTINVTAAGGLPGYDLVGAMDAWVQLQAAGPMQAKYATCTTRRRGLVRRLQRAGYSITGYVLRKDF